MKVNEQNKTERNNNAGIRTQKKINQQKGKMILSCH